MNIVNVAAFRSEADHLFRLANVDYQACVSAAEVENWKATAARVLANAEQLECKRAKADDRAQFTQAISTVKARLVEADARIAELQARNRLFIGRYPGGIVYADRHRERAGDYARVGFLTYGTLELTVEPDCPEVLRQRVIADAAQIQARKGQEFPIAGNMTIILGHAIKPS